MTKRKDKERIMAKITCNGMKLDEVTETKVFDEPHDMFVWNNSDSVPTRMSVCAIIPYRHAGSVITTNGAYEHCAEIPEKPAPRMVTNRELAKWLAQGNGEVLSLMPTTNGHPREVVTTDWYYFSGDDSKNVDYGFEGQRCKGVRKWDDEEWLTPDVEYMGITEVKTYEDVVKREG